MGILVAVVHVVGEHAVFQKKTDFAARPLAGPPVTEVTNTSAGATSIRAGPEGRH